MMIFIFIGTIILVILFVAFIFQMKGGKKLNSSNRIEDYSISLEAIARQDASLRKIPGYSQILEQRREKKLNKVIRFYIFKSETDSNWCRNIKRFEPINLETGETNVLYLRGLPIGTIPNSVVTSMGEHIHFGQINVYVFNFEIDYDEKTDDNQISIEIAIDYKEYA